VADPIMGTASIALDARTSLFAAADSLAFCLGDGFCFGDLHVPACQSNKNIVWPLIGWKLSLRKVTDFQIEKFLPLSSVFRQLAQSTMEEDHGFPSLTGEDIINCSFSTWYAKYHRLSPRARIIKPLPEEFIKFLKSDGIVIPGEYVLIKVSN